LSITAPSADAQETSPPITRYTEDTPATELRKQIEENYRKMDRAWERYDVNAAVQFMPMDYTYIVRGGKKLTLSDHKSTWRKIVSRALGVKLNTEINVFTVKGDTITVETRKVIAVKMRRDDGSQVYADGFQQDRDFWIKRNGKWIIKQTRIYDFTLNMNGQLIKE
jgi:hypothetical protein